MSNSIKIQWSEIIKRVQFKLKYRMAKERIHIYVLGKGLVKKIRQKHYLQRDILFSYKFMLRIFGLLHDIVLQEKSHLKHNNFRK